MRQRKKKGVNLGGRPTKKTPVIIRKLKSIFQIDGTISEACSHAGISKDTYYEWIKKDKEFSDEMDAAKEYCFILARKKLVKDIRDDNTDAKSSIEFLRRRDKRYKDKVENEVSGSITNINFEFKEADHSNIDENGEEKKD